MYHNKSIIQQIRTKKTQVILFYARHGLKKQESCGNKVKIVIEVRYVIQISTCEDQVQ